MLPEEDRLALKKNGYKISPKGVISPIAHPLQTHNRKSSSSEVQHRQGERDSLNNSRRPQPKPKLSTNRREWDNGLSSQPKPKVVSTNRREWDNGLSSQPKPKVVSTNRREWDNGLSSQPKPKVVSNNRREWGNGLSSQPKPKVVSNNRREWDSGLSSQPKPKVVSTNRREWDSGLSSQPKPKVVSTNRREWDNGLSSQPKPKVVSTNRREWDTPPQPKPLSKLRGMPPDAIERWSNAANSSKPASKLRGMSPDTVERWSNPTENREATPASNERPMSMSTFQQDFGRGLLNAAWDAVQEAGDLAVGLYDLTLNPNQEVREQTAQSVGEGVGSLIHNPAMQSVANPILAVRNFTSRPGETIQAFKDIETGIAQPYVDAWRSGHPGEAVGRGTFDVLSIFIPGGAITKPSRATTVTSTVGTAANVADEAGDITRVTGRIAGAKQALNPQNAAPSGRGSRPLGERPTSNSAPSTDRRSTAKPPRSTDLPQSSNGGTNNPPTGHNTNRPGNNAAPSGTGSRPLGAREPGSETGRVGTGEDRANIFSQRLEELSVHPRTGKPNRKSREEAETILQAEQQGLLQGTPHRPFESRQSEGLDFELKDHNGRVIGYADTKNPIEPKFRAVSKQAEDITKKINSYQPNLNLKVVIDLKNFDSAQKLEFKAYLADQVEDMSKVIFLND